MKSWSKESHLIIFGWLVSSTESKTQKEGASTWVLQSEWRDREWECERVTKKKKMRHFYLLKLRTRKINWWSSISWSFWVLQSWRVGVFRRRFCYWLCGEILFNHWDLFIVYPIYCGLKFSINLIVGCNLYFIVDIFRSCPMIFPSTPEGFSRKIWCSYMVVFIWCLLKFFVSIILLLLGNH